MKIVHLQVERDSFQSGADKIEGFFWVAFSAQTSTKSRSDDTRFIL